MKKLLCIICSFIMIATSIPSVWGAEEVKATEIELDETNYKTNMREDFIIRAEVYSGYDEIEKEVKWSTTDEKVATVDEWYTNSAEVCIVGVGTCYIVAELDGITAKCKITVKKPKNQFEYTVLKDNTIRIDDYNWFSEEVTIPKTYKGRKVTRIKYLCEDYQSSFAFVKKINIPSTVTKIGKPVPNQSSYEEINVSKKNKVYSSVKGVLFNKAKTKLIAYPCCKRNSKYTVPKSVKVIGKGSFTDDPRRLEEVKLQKGIVTIEMGAFEDASIKKVNIPNTVKTIEDYAFASTFIMKIKIPKSVTKIGKGALGYTVYDPYTGYIKGFKIIGYKGSEAERYAKKHKKLKFIAIN